MSPTILVIDDDEIVRRLVMYALKPFQIDILEAVNAAAALVIASESVIDLALVDINLPDMNGFQLIQRLKEDPHLQNIPLIVFTARLMPDDEAHTMEVGAQGFISKPFHTLELRNMVLKLLGLS